MKTFITLIILLFSFQLYAAACKCNCDPYDRNICASNYDLDHPCGSVCHAPVAGIAPMITACPVKRTIDELTGAVIWMVHCD